MRRLSGAGTVRRGGHRRASGYWGGLSVHVTGGRHDAAQLDTSLYPAEGCFFVSGNRHGRVMERVLREALREDQDELTLAEARELAEEEACNHFGMTSTSSDGPPRRGRSRRTTRWSRISPS